MNVLGYTPIVDGRQLVRVRPYAITADDVIEELNLVLNELAFLQLRIKLMLS